MSDQKSFTLIELLIVIGILAILVAAVVVTLNPAQLLAQARDSKRQQDLSALNQALNTITALDQSLFMGTSSIVYTSLPDSTTTCANWNLPSLPSGWQYHCAPTTTLQNTDGTGWIPVNFKTTGVVSLASLPLDPINTSSTGLYYTYVSGGSFELNGILESTKYRSNTSLSKPNFPGVLSYGSNQALSPLYNTLGLVGYWPFDEGTGTIAYDKSGNGNNGTLAAGVLWKNGSDCRTGMCVDFIPGSLITVNNTSSINLPSALTITGWFYPISTPAGDTATMIFSKWASTSDANYVWYWYTHVSWCPDCNGILGNVGGTWGGITNYGNLPIGQWYDFALTYSSTTGANLYINAVLTRQDAYRGSLGTNSANLIIGADGGGFEHRFDDLRLYNRALSASEIRALYNATK